MKTKLFFLPFFLAVSAQAQVSVDSAGFVSVGSTSAAFRLDVKHNNYNAIRASGNSSNAVGIYINNSVSGGNQWGITSSGGGPAPAGSLVFWDDGAQKPRMTLSPAGNVGIGTTNPTAKFDVQGIHGDTALRLFSDSYGQGVDGANTAVMYLWASEPGVSWTGGGIGNNVKNGSGINRVTNTRGASYMRLLDNVFYLSTVDNQGVDRVAISGSNGDVGIGTTTPAARLHVHSVSDGTSFYFTTNSASVGWNGGAYADDSFRINHAGVASRLVINSSGNVGIGTTSLAEKLHVVGKIRATSFISDTGASGYADFVFEPDYDLPSLSSIKAHIEEHGHLPDIPSEAEAMEQGIDLGVMQVRLLQKIEELTLHQIAQEERLNGQAERIDQLETENLTLRERQSF